MEQPIHYVDIEYDALLCDTPRCGGVHFIILGRFVCIPRSDIREHARERKRVCVRGYPVDRLN